MGTIWSEFGLDTTKLDMGVARASASLKGLESRSNALTGAFKSASVGIGLIGGAIAIAAVKLATDFDSSMHKAWSVTDATKGAMQEWSAEVLKMSTRLPVAAKDLADALYWIKSDMPDATDAEQFKTLEIAAKGAVGGVAELSDATEALITAQNAYNDMDPAKYMDIMNWAVKRGSITLQDFVANQGKAVGTAAMAKVPFSDLAASVATLTRKGVPADTAFMALNQTMMAFLKNTDEAALTAQKYGIDMSLAGLRAKGLGGALLEIAQKVPDEELANLFPNIRALKAVFPLAGTASEEFAKDLSLVGEASGTTAKMFAKQMDDLKNKATIMFNKIKKPLIELGMKMFPTLERAIASVIRALEGKNEALNNLYNFLKKIGTAIYDVGRFILVTKPLLYGLGAAFAAIKIANLVTGLTGLSGMMAILGKFGGSTLGTTLGVAAINAGQFAHFAGMAATTGGTLGTVLSGIASVALPAAAALAGTVLVGGLLVKTILDYNKANREAEKSIKANTKELGKHAEAAVPLIDKLWRLRSELTGLDKGSAAYKAKTTEMISVQKELIAAYPGLLEYMGLEHAASLKQIMDIKDIITQRMKEAGITARKPGEGWAGDIAEEMDKLAKKREIFKKMSATGGEIIDLAKVAGFSPGQVDKLRENLDDGVKQAEKYYRDVLRKLDQAGKRASEGKSALAQGFSGMGKDLGAGAAKVPLGPAEEKAFETYTKLEEKAKQAKAALAIANFEISQSIKEALRSIAEQAPAAGAAGQSVADEILSALRSNRGSIVQAGRDALSEYFRGAAEARGTGGSALTQLAMGLSNQLSSGQFKIAWETAGRLGVTDLVQKFVGDMVTTGIPSLNSAFSNIPKGMSSALTSSQPEIRTAAAAALNPFLLELASLDTKSPQIAQDVANKTADNLAKGNWEATASDNANRFLVQLAASMGETGKLDPALKALADKMKKAGELGEGKDKKITLNISDGGTGKSTTKSLSQVEDKANKLAGISPTIKVRGGDQPASNKLDSFVKRAQDLNGQTLASVNILAKILTQSTPREWEHADEAGAYLANEIAAGGNAANASISIAAGASNAMAGGGLQGYIDKLKVSWEALNKTAIYGWSQVYTTAAGRYKEMEDAIMGLSNETGAYDETMGSQLATWRTMRGALEEAQAALKTYDEQMEASDAITNQLQHSQELLNRELSVHQETLSRLQSFKIAGEIAASGKSFDLQHRIKGLNIEILKAKEEGRLKDAMALSIEKKRLEKEKEILDAQTDYDYEKQKRDLEKLLDPLGQQEMQYGDLVNAIKAEQVAIDEKKAKLKEIELQLDVERDKQWALKIEHDNAAKAVALYSEQVEAMAKNFLSRYDEMIAKQKELNDLQTGASGGAAAGGAALTASGGRAVDMSRVAAGGASVSQVSNTILNASSIVNNYHFDSLVLPNVTDYKSLKRELGKDAKLRLAVPS
jgi:TP901 family phage tail tape measure protein